MKLAEALLLRADTQKKIAQLRDRIVGSAVVQEGDKPHEDPNELLKQAAGAMQSLEELVVKINRANLATKLPDGRTLTEAIAHRDLLVSHHALLGAAIAASKRDPARYGQREIKWVAVLEIAKLHKQVEDLAKRIRELNGLVQQTNWSAELGD